MNSAALDRIHAEVTAGGVVVYMRGTVAFPLCGGSAAVAQILDHLKIRYRAIDVMADSGLNAGLRKYADWPTLPQLYVDGEFIGGPDIVQELYATQELHELLAGHHQ